MLKPLVQGPPSNCLLPWSTTESSYSKNSNAVGPFSADTALLLGLHSLSPANSQIPQHVLPFSLMELDSNQG